ncbi:hypothetical protein H9P43_004704 [Blastocladiella emersonii ATCC 22665]|nr:hypothetical protein H9P43_004704 [Blastocladiella emersonii ATCC 22665]
MTHPFPSAMLLQVVAHTLAQAGFAGFKHSALEVLLDVLERYLGAVAARAAGAGETAGRTRATLHDAAYALDAMEIDVVQLAEFVQAGWTAKLANLDVDLRLDGVATLPIPHRQMDPGPNAVPTLPPAYPLRVPAAVLAGHAARDPLQRERLFVEPVDPPVIHALRAPSAPIAPAAAEPPRQASAETGTEDDAAPAAEEGLEVDLALLLSLDRVLNPPPRPAIASHPHIPTHLPALPGSSAFASAADTAGSNLLRSASSKPGASSSTGTAAWATTVQPPSPKRRKFGSSSDTPTSTPLDRKALLEMHRKGHRVPRPERANAALNGHAVPPSRPNPNPSAYLRKAKPGAAAAAGSKPSSLARAIAAANRASAAVPAPTPPSSATGVGTANAVPAPAKPAAGAAAASAWNPAAGTSTSVLRLLHRKPVSLATAPDALFTRGDGGELDPLLPNLALVASSTSAEDPPDEDNKAGTEEIHCICDQARVDDAGLMVACDSCGVWFHGKCVHITAAMVHDGLTWYCPRCIKAGKLHEIKAAAAAAAPGALMAGGAK